MPEPLLSVRALTKRFGGVDANVDISLDVTAGEVHAIIGPNGAGKTTFNAQLSGDLFPDAGEIVFDGRDITRAPPNRRSMMGLARSFQITSIFKAFTALDNSALAVQAHAGHSFRFWRPARRIPELREPAMLALEQVGLGPVADTLAANLSHGEHRQLEIAMALATKPKMLLLDEPTAGMSAEETDRMVALLSELKGKQTILLIEHDMDAVFALADRITVFVGGRTLVTGLPDEIRNNARVREAYLGEEGESFAAGADA